MGFLRRQGQFDQGLVNQGFVNYGLVNYVWFLTRIIFQDGMIAGRNLRGVLDRATQLKPHAALALFANGEAFALEQ